MCLFLFLLSNQFLYTIIQIFYIELGQYSIVKESDWLLFLLLVLPFFVGFSFYSLSIYGIL